MCTTTSGIVLDFRGKAPIKMDLLGVVGKDFLPGVDVSVSQIPGWGLGVSV